jgi:hypothetical protein
MTNKLYLSGSVEGVTMLVNKTHIVSVHMKSTAFAILKMVNGDEIKFPLTSESFRELTEMQLPPTSPTVR